MPKVEAFNGTSIAPSHVGDTVADSLNTLSVEATVNAEAANAIAVDLQVKDANGKNFKAVTRLHWRTYSAAMLESLVAAYTCAETGAGSEVTTTAQPALIIDTDANGAAQVTVTDVATTSTDTLNILVEFLDKPGRTELVTITFA